MTMDHASLFAALHETGIDQDVRVRHAISIIKSHPDPSTRDRLIGQLTQAVERVRALNPKSPFTPPPQGLVSDRACIVGFDAHTNEPITIGPEDVASVIALPGATGSGKTTLILHLVAQLIAYVRLWILDLKDDYRALAASDPRIVILHPNAPYNIITPPSHLSVADNDHLLCNTIASSFYLGQHGRSALANALVAARADNEHACIADVTRALDASITKADTFSDRDTKHGLADRLRRLTQSYPGLTTTRRGITTSTILDGHGLYVPAPLFTENEEWLFGHHILHLFLSQAHHARRNGLDHVIVNDEGVQTWNKQNKGHITETPPFLSLMGKTRELSIGALISTNSWTTTHDALKSNANTLLITKLASHDDEHELAQTIGLNTAQAEYLKYHLTRGQVIVRLRDRWRQPILATFPPVPYEKNVNPAVWEAAKARTNLLAPLHLTPLITIAPNTSPARTVNPGTTRTSPQPETITLPLPVTISPNTPKRSTTPAKPPTTPARQADAPPATPSAPVIALNKHEEALLRVVCDGVTASTPAYKKAGLTLADGDEAAKRLSQKALINRERITLRGGRGGHGVGLQATTAGLNRLGLARSVKTRGGDAVQHQYLVQELHRVLPDSTVEGIVGTKSVDLLIALNKGRDQQLLTFINERAKHSTTALNNGSLIALEVETSAPAKTSPNNITKNHEAGIALTLVLVLPKEESTLKKTLTNSTSLPSTYAVMNVLALLEHLGG